jgi:signal transduction histidine kinase/CheY-like chemotaxis protein
VTEHDPRLDEILEVLLALARQDFSQRAPVHGTDTLAAIATGLNMLAEELDGAVASRRDLETAYSALKEADARLVQAGKMIAVGQLASAVAHEINNPATWVSLGLTLLARATKDLRKNLELEKIDRQALAATLDRMDLVLRDAVEGMDRIRVVVGDLRTFSRGDDESLEDVSINDVIRTSCNLAGPSFRERAELVLDLEETPLLIANRGRLAQVVTNLLVNAAHAVQDSPRGDHEIAVMTRSQDGGVLIAVEDTGGGVPLEHREKIFEPLFTTKPATKGTGLGLTIVAQLVQGYGGFVRAVDGSRCGARLEVWLPCKTRTPRPPPPAPASDRPTRSMRLLVVDDEPAILRAIQGVLEGEGHDVVLAAGGAEAIELLRDDESYDALFCDLHMPDVDGIAVHAWLRSHRPLLAEHVIFLTAALASDRARHFVSSVNPVVVSKPVSAADLERALARLIDGR